MAPVAKVDRDDLDGHVCCHREQNDVPQGGQFTYEDERCGYAYDADMNQEAGDSLAFRSDQSTRLEYKVSQQMSKIEVEKQRHQDSIVRPTSTPLCIKTERASDIKRGRPCRS